MPLQEARQIAMSDHSLARLRAVFDVTPAQASLVIGVLGPFVYVMGYMVLYNLGVDAAMAGREPSLAWNVVSGVWMFGFPLVGMAGIVLGTWGQSRADRVFGGVGIACNTVWLLAWLLLVLLVASGASV